jgi:hypothetical protein
MQHWPESHIFANFSVNSQPFAKMFWPLISDPSAIDKKGRVKKMGLSFKLLITCKRHNRQYIHFFANVLYNIPVCEIWEGQRQCQNAAGLLSAFQIIFEIKVVLHQFYSNMRNYVNAVFHCTVLYSRGSRFLIYNFLQFTIGGKNNSKTKVEKVFFFIFMS